MVGEEQAANMISINLTNSIMVVDHNFRIVLTGAVEIVTIVAIIVVMAAHVEEASMMVSTEEDSPEAGDLIEATTVVE